MLATCMPRVQLYVHTCSGWPQFALQHHWLLPINCHFLRLYSAAGRGIAAVSSAIEESDLYLFSCETVRGGNGIMNCQLHKLHVLCVRNRDPSIYIIICAAYIMCTR